MMNLELKNSGKDSGVQGGGTKLAPKNQFTIRKATFETSLAGQSLPAFLIS
jgi:hypothetical protein